VKVTIARACKNVEPIKSLSGMQYSGYRVSKTPVWDFRGVAGLDLTTLSGAVRGVIYQLNEIQISQGMERHFVFGMVEKLQPSGEFTGLVTEKDWSLLDELQAARKDRWVIKPLFWIAVWIAPLIGFGLATVIVVELGRWIIRGFRPSAEDRP
jgi:hypothetical protein